MKSCVYFIGIKGQPFVKVGRSADFTGRILSLYTALPFVLDEVGRLDGAAEVEAECHKALRRCRVYGEWFDREEATTLFHILKNADSISEGIARYNERFPVPVKVSLSQHKQSIAAIITELTKEQSVAELAKRIGVSPATIQNAKRGRGQLQPHSLFNLISIKPDALDIMFAPYGRKTEPAIKPALESLAALKARCHDIRKARAA